MARFTRAQLEAFNRALVDDLVGERVRLLFVGINPGLWTAAVNAHFARRGNRFWPALHAAGITPYVVDSNRCISYATIELRDDELPLDPTGWVYGCDVCQDVCPWNRFRQESAESGYRPRATLMNPTVESLAKMSEDEFALQFRNSAIKRTKHQGLVRNARALQKSAPSGFPSDQGA